ncbi:PleD family two-component system response regulator [Brucella sp. 10RB9213]|uniref:PleD family two-component system response regulator n=1 Tax=Brucella sp. 10RB9213 TaxID=1844039 RepID=UPI0012AD21E0|nr:PleD family two-component system response regulator [Brucella sp. 10RB9213]MRN65902.1 PleD family two-component system response regulator [Brucella sp. 10RB9213]
MTARILVVDDVDSNVKLLEARLLSEYYEVVPAYSGAEAIEICLDGQIDIVLLDVLMPGLDGFEVCRRLKANPRTANIPVIMITCLTSPEDKVRGLEAGAEDFLSKPVNDLELLSRLKSLTRLKMMSDELFQRAGRIADAEVDALLARKMAGKDGNRDEVARILVVDEDELAAARLRHILDENYRVDVASDAETALIRAIETDYDTIIVSASFTYYDPLKLCTQLRTIQRTRLIPIILMVWEDEGALVVRALELGVNDYLMRPLEKIELFARLRTQIKRKCYNDILRQSMERTITQSVTDGLTGLHNRRYIDMHMPLLLTRAIERKQPLSIIMIDLDHFKQVNEQYGHGAGDHVLREFSARLRRNIRGMDLISRYGGEEFVVVLPDTDRQAAFNVAERVRGIVAEAPFVLDSGKRRASLTVSVGVAALRPAGDSLEALFTRATDALIQAKQNGRNRIVLSAA